MKNPLKILVFFSFLLGAAFAACTSANLSSILNGTINTTAGQCFNVTDDVGGSNASFIVSGPAPVNITLTIGPNQTTNSSSGAWGTCTASGNLTIINQTSSLNLSLNITAQNGTQSFSGIGYSVNVSACASPPVISLNVTPQAGVQFINGPGYAINVSAIPPLNLIQTVSDTSTINTSTGPYWTVQCQDVLPATSVGNVSLTPGASIPIFQPGTNLLISTVSCAMQQICTQNLNFSPTFSDQAYSNYLSPCNITINVSANSYGICNENRNEIATNFTIWRSNNCNDTFTCSPAPGAGQCPVSETPAASCPAMSFSLVPGQTEINGTVLATCANQTTTVAVPFSSSAQNLSCGQMITGLSLCSSDVADAAEVSALKGGNLSNYTAEKNGACLNDLSALQNQCLGAGGYTAQLQNLTTQCLTGPNNYKEQADSSTNWISYIAIGVCIALLLFFGVMALLGRLNSDPAKIPAQPRPLTTGEIARKLDRRLTGGNDEKKD